MKVTGDLYVQTFASGLSEARGVGSSMALMAAPDGRGLGEWL